MVTFSRAQMKEHKLILEGNGPVISKDDATVNRELPIDEQVQILFDHELSKTYNINLPDEQWLEEDREFTADQLFYYYSVHLAYQLKDEFENLKKLKQSIKLKDLPEDFELAKIRHEAEQIYYQHVDNTLGWMMDNAPNAYTVFWARTVMAIFRIQFDPKGMKNWDRFSDNYQDLILAA